MIILKGIPFLLPAGKRIGTAQLAGKKEHLFQRNRIVKSDYFLISMHYRPLTIQISTLKNVS